MSGSPSPAGLYRADIPYRVLIEEAERTILEEALSLHENVLEAVASDMDYGMMASWLNEGGRMLAGTD